MHECGGMVHVKTHHTPNARSGSAGPGWRGREVRVSLGVHKERHERPGVNPHRRTLGILKFLIIRNRKINEIPLTNRAPRICSASGVTKPLSNTKMMPLLL